MPSKTPRQKTGRRSKWAAAALIGIGLLVTLVIGGIHGETEVGVAQRLLLQAQTAGSGASLILVTHSAQAAARADRVWHLTAQGLNETGPHFAAP